MEIINTSIPEVKLIKPQVFGDNRGWFYESYSKEKLQKLGIDTVFVQDNRSFSAAKGTLRGIHFQKNPSAQTKLICCTKGKILDVAVDLRKDSPTYLKWVSYELTEENKYMLYIPKGFGHGFLTLTENVEVLYKVDEYYDSKNDRSIKYNDEKIGINWGVDSPVLSQKDLSAPSLDESDADFVYEVKE